MCCAATPSFQTSSSTEPESSGQQASSSKKVASMSKKGQPWTEEEHLRFLEGLSKLGKGQWRAISRQFVPSRTPTQVASHAQKHFLRLGGCTKRKSRFAAIEHEVLGLPEKPAATSSSPAVSVAPSFPAMPVPCMIPPVFFTFPGAGFMSPLFFPQAALAVGKQGMVMSMLPGFTSMGIAIGTVADSDHEPSGRQSEHTVVCKPEATLASSSSGTTELLNSLPVSNETHVELHASMHSAFRPPADIRALG